MSPTSSHLGDPALASRDMDLGQKEHAGGSLNASQLVFPGIHHILARVLEGRAVSLLLLDLSWNYPSVS